MAVATTRVSGNGRRIDGIACPAGSPARCGRAGAGTNGALMEIRLEVLRRQRAADARELGLLAATGQRERLALQVVAVDRVGEVGADAAVDVRHRVPDDVARLAGLVLRDARRGAGVEAGVE